MGYYFTVQSECSVEMLELDYEKMSAWGVVCGIFGLFMWFLATSILGHVPVYPWTAIFLFIIIGCANGLGYSQIEDFEWVGSLAIAVLIAVIVTSLGSLPWSSQELYALIVTIVIGLVVGAVSSGVFVWLRQIVWGE